MNSLKLFLEKNKDILNDYILLKVREGYTCFFSCDDENLDKLDDDIYHNSGGNFWIQPRLIEQSELNELKEIFMNE